MDTREQPYVPPYVADPRTPDEAASEFQAAILAFDAAFHTAEPTEEEKADSRGGSAPRRISLTGDGTRWLPWAVTGMTAVALIAAVVSVQLVALTAPAATGSGGTAIAMSDAPSPETDFTLPATMASFAASPPPNTPPASASPSAATPSAAPSTQPAGSMPISQPSPTATYAQPVPAVLVDPGSGHCLNVNTADNSVGIWSCDGRPSQQWIATAAAELRTQGTGLCLAPASDTVHPGTRVMVRSCTGSESQKWTAQSDGSLVNTSSGLCLDVLNGYTNNGAPLQLWTCG